MVLTARNTLLFIIVIAVAVFIESSIPYLCAERNAPPGYRFSGQIAYSADQNMYFSFISQARDGAFLLNNKLTATPNKPVFVNLEYWLIGFVQRVTGISENAVYQVWRLLGLVLLVIGFHMLTKAVLPTYKQRLAAFAAFFCTGGFGFVFGLLDRLHLVGFDAMQSGIIDARYGMVPLQQIISNPHFSLPHGLILIAYAFFVMGERNEKLKYYVYSGLMFTLIGLVRPYDILPPFIILPLYALVTNGGFRFDVTVLLRRMLPLVMLLPVLAYNVWLFKFNDIFKYWSLQGHNAGALPGAGWHYMAYGIVGLLAIVRLLQAKKCRPGKTGMFVLLWFTVTFIFIQLGRYFPVIGWSPQIGVYLAAPLTLAAFSLKFEDLFGSKRLRYVVVPAVVGVIVVSNLFVVMYHARKFVGNVKTEVFYTSDAEMQAFAWLRANTKSGEVVLADNPSSQRIPKYTSNRVVAAHYSVTPMWAESNQLVAAILSQPSMLTGEEALPAGTNIDYIYTKHDGTAAPTRMGKFLREVYRNSGVSICRVVLAAK